MTLPSGTYGIWPVNMPLAGATIVYATAQPMLKLEVGSDSRYYFVASQGISTEFSWAASGGTIHARSGQLETTAAGLFTANVQPSYFEPAFTVTFGHTKSEVFVLSEQDAENLWRYQSDSGTHLVLTPDEFWAEKTVVHLDRRGDPNFSFIVSPADRVLVQSATDVQVRLQKNSSVVKAKLSAASPQVAVSPLQGAKVVPAVQIGPAPSWRAGVATVPDDETLSSNAAKWALLPSTIDWTKVKDVFLQVKYKGDVARLFSGDRLLDDDFYNGMPWELGLRRYKKQSDQGLALSILPLRGDAPIFLERSFRPKPAGQQVISLDAVTVIPQYELNFSFH